MTGEAEHRWLGYRPVIGDDFIAVCSCGWSSPPQRTAGLAGALLDAHRAAARNASASDGHCGPDGGAAIPRTVDADDADALSRSEGEPA